MEEVFESPDVKEEKPEIMEVDQVEPVRLKIIKIGGADKTGQGTLDQLQFVEMAQLARQAVAIANGLGGSGNNRKRLVGQSKEVASDEVSEEGLRTQGLKGRRRETGVGRSKKESAALSDDKRAETRKNDAERMRKWRAALSDEQLVAVRTRAAERRRHLKAVRRSTEMAGDVIGAASRESKNKSKVTSDLKKRRNLQHSQPVETAKLSRQAETTEMATALVKASDTRHLGKGDNDGAKDVKATRRRKDAERMRKRRAAWTEEERAAYRKKEAERKRKVRAEMSEEKRAECSKKAAERQRRRMTLMTPKEIEHLGEVDAEGKRIQRTRMTPEAMAEYRQKSAQCMRKRRQKLTEEEKAEFRRKCATYQFMRLAAMTKEEREEHAWKKRMAAYAREAEMTREEREQENRRVKERNRKWREGLTGERLERYKESLARANKKYQQKCPPQKKSPNYMQKRYHKMVRVETPEQRWKRLRAYRICQSKRQLRSKLEQEGFPQEEIEERVQDLVKKMKEEPMPPPDAVSTYKPRPRKNQKEPVDDSEPQTSTVRVRTTRSKNNCAPISSKDSSLFGDMKTIEAEPIVAHVFTDYPVDHNENVSDEDDASCDAFDHYDIQSDPLENNEESEIEETLNSSSTSPPTPPVETPRATDTFADCDIQSDPDPLEKNEEDEDDTEEITNSYPAPTPPPLESPATPQQCPHCPLTFNYENLLKDHLRSSHLNKCFKCPKCKEIVLSPKELSDHFKMHQSQPQKQSPSASTNTSPFTCIKCPTGVGFQSQEKLSEHVRLSHPGSFFPCINCKVVMYTKPSLATHLIICKTATEQDWVVPRKGNSRNSKLKKCTDW